MVQAVARARVWPVAHGSRVVERPLPNVRDELARPFWNGLREARLVLQRCTKCGYLRWPIAPLCPDCLEEAAEWRSTPAEGTIWSLGVYEHGYHPAFVDLLPYTVALVQLDAGPRMIANVLDAPADLAVGTRVGPVFEAISEAVTLLQFRVAPTVRDGGEGAKDP